MSQYVILQTMEAKLLYLTDRTIVMSLNDDYCGSPIFLRGEMFEVGEVGVGSEKQIVCDTIRFNLINKL